MYNWISPSTNWVFYLEGSTVKRRKLSDGTTSTALTGIPTPRILSAADLATRLYFTVSDSKGAGMTQCHIDDGNNNVDIAFRGPLSFTSFTATDNGVGLCTKGLHSIGFVFQSRSGFSGQPSPVNGFGVFIPATVTLNAGLRTIRASVTLDTPADAGFGSLLFPIMTRSDNQNTWFFVPETFYAPDPLGLPPSVSGWTFTVDISISDEDLANSAQSADDQFNLLVAGSGGGPFNPNFVMAYGKRMCYGADTNLYVSEIDNPQAITDDFNRINLPSQRHIGFAFPLGLHFYLTGDKWTGQTLDNGDLPATWSQPAMVSDAIGAPFPGCVEWRTVGAYVWVAAESGFYVFTGTYPNRPISYLQSDIWSRINWAAAYVIQIADDVPSLRVKVAVPLDGAVECTHVLVYDYTNGITFDTCDFSLDIYNAATFSSIAMVKESAAARSVLWIGPSSAADVLHSDTTTHNDDGVAIHSIWESGYARNAGEVQAKTIRVGNADLWIRGNGPLIHIWKGMDGTPVVTPVLMATGDVILASLAPTPGIEYFAKGDLSPVANYSMRFETNAVGAWFELSGFSPYYRPALWTQ